MQSALLNQRTHALHTWHTHINPHNHVHTHQMLMGTLAADFDKFSTEFIKGIRLFKTLMEDNSAIVSVYVLANYI